MTLNDWPHVAYDLQQLKITMLANVRSTLPGMDRYTAFFFNFLKNYFIYLFNLFICLWLCWVFVSVRGLPPVAASGGHSYRGAWASHSHGLSCCGAQAPDTQAQ